MSNNNHDSSLERNVIEVPEAVVEALEVRLADLAHLWVNTGNNDIVEEYAVIFNFLFGVKGWEGDIDVDTLLPDDYMPRAYLLLDEQPTSA